MLIDISDLLFKHILVLDICVISMQLHLPSIPHKFQVHTLKLQSYYCTVQNFLLPFSCSKIQQKNNSKTIYGILRPEPRITN